MSPYIAILTIIYVLTKRRYVDFLTLAVFSSAFYCMPIFFGYVWYRDGIVGAINPITVQMHAVYSMIFASLLISCIVNDYLVRPVHGKTKPIVYNELRMFGVIALLFWAIFAFVHVQDLIFARKENFGSLHSLAFTSVTVALVMSVVARAYMWSVVFILLATIDMYAGNREVIAFTALSLFILGTSSLGRVRLLNYYKYILAMGAIVALLMVYKMIGAVIVLQRWDLVTERLLDLNFYTLAVARSEPFVTQSLLYYAIENRWVFTQSLTLNIAIILLPFGSLFQDSLVSVSSQVNQYMSYLDYGVASNIWAEAYMLGGFPGVFIFCLFYATLPVLINIMFGRWRSLSVRCLIALTGVTFLFFIHRTGIEYSINIFKRFFMYTIMMSVLFYILSSFTRK